MKNKELIVDNGKLTMESFKIGDKKYLELIMGQSPPSKFYNTDKIGLPFFQGKKQFGKLYPTVDTWCSEPKKIALKGDILLSVRAPVGPTNLAKEKCCIGRGLAALRPNAEKLLTKYVLYFFNNLELELQSKGQGSTFKAIAAKDLRNMTIACPPLSEQRRIVSKLDGLFAEIDASLALIDQNIAQAEVLKMSVLDEEFGRIKEECYEEKFDNILLDKLIGLVRSRKEQGPDREVDYLKMNNITNDGNLDLGDVVKVDLSKEEIDKFKLEKGDFLFNTRNSVELVGKTAVFSEDRLMVFNNNIMRARFKNNISSKFINYQFHTSKLKSQLNIIKSGTTNVAAIYYKSLRNLKVMIHPTIDEQNKLVQKLDCLFSEVDALILDYTQKRANLEALKSSLLDQAFKGEL